MKISVILPTYNEAGNITALVKAIIGQAGLKRFKLEIIVIDDDSPDHTAGIVKALSGKYPVKLIVRKNQHGLATAILRGIQQATGQVIVLMDTDFNHQPKDIIRLVEPVVAGRVDLVIGSRYIKGGGVYY